MGLSDWGTYNLSITRYYPDDLGVYELVDEDKITLYYGYGNIRIKLLEHIKNKDFPSVRYFRFEKLEEEECRLKMLQLFRDYQKKFNSDLLPMYNEKEKQV